jgi:hypothetical protein
MPPRKNQEEEHEAFETKRNAKALSVAQFLVTLLDANGVAELLSLLNGTDWNRVEEYLRSSDWLDGRWQPGAEDEVENRYGANARSRGTATTDATAKRAMSLEVNS